jgi:glutamate synthase domain-containing protein 2
MDQSLPMDAHRRSSAFPPEVIAQIQRTAAEGHYEIRGWGAKRALPTFDDLLFLTASLTRYPLEGYREKCDTATVLGTRYASKPLELAIPVTIAGMSFGALSATAKVALGRAASAVGTSTTTGDGGMIPEERAASRLLVYQCLPSRYGFNPDDLRQADAIEIVIGQGAKPGGGGLLLGQKVTDRVAGMRTLPPGVDQRSASRHPDWVGPDDLRIKIEELREATRWEKPIYVKFGATRVVNDVKLAVAARTSWWSTGCRAGRRPPRTSTSSTPASRPWPRCGWPRRRYATSAWRTPFSSSSPAASVTAPTWPRRSRSARTRSRSGWPR